MDLEGSLDRCDAVLISGWARFRSEPARRATLGVFCRGELIGCCTADQYRVDLQAVGGSDARFGFSFKPPSTMSPAALRTVRLVVAGCDGVFEFGHKAPRGTPLPAPAYYQRSTPDSSRKRFATCILHIGIEKTGTTTLQRALGLNTAAFSRAGFFIPRCLAPHARQGSLNHSHLATLAMADDDFENGLRIDAQICGPEALLGYRRQIFQQFELEVDCHAGSCGTLLLSNEHCHSRLATTQSIRHLKSFLDPFCDEYRIVVYLRAQHELAISQYGMMVMLGIVDIDMFPPMPPPPHYRKTAYTSRRYFDHASLLARWAAVFGEDAMQPRVFERAALTRGSVVDDFVGLLGAELPALVRTPDRNHNVSPAAQQFLIKLYGAAAGSPISAATRQRLSHALQAACPGAGVLPGRAEAQAFLERFAADNETVRARWFADRRSLFEPDFSRYPLTSQRVQMSETDLLRMAVTAFEALATLPE